MMRRCTGLTLLEMLLVMGLIAMLVLWNAGSYRQFVAQQAVEHYGWLKPGEMLDGLGLAETTPGPLIMVTQFVGFLAAYRTPGALPPLAAGTLGGLLTTWVTFAPCFLWIFVGAPYVERLRSHRALAGALAAITAAVEEWSLSTWMSQELEDRKASAKRSPDTLVTWGEKEKGELRAVARSVWESWSTKSPLAKEIYESQVAFLKSLGKL